MKTNVTLHGIRSVTLEQRYQTANDCYHLNIYVFNEDGSEAEITLFAGNGNGPVLIERERGTKKY